MNNALKKSLMSFKKQKTSEKDTNVSVSYSDKQIELLKTVRKNKAKRTVRENFLRNQSSCGWFKNRHLIY